MRNIKLLLEYDGSRYDGWVKSERSQGKKDGSISDRITEVLKAMEGTDVELIPAIRTEAGVHALHQVACFKTSSLKPTKEIKQYLNRYLPRDIAVLDVGEVDERFHPCFNAKGFSFEYRLTVGEVPSVFERKYNHYCFKPLDVKAMKDAATRLVGKHDFKGFSDNPKMKKSSIREVSSVSIYDAGNEISITITGDDFWPNMVRIIVAMLVSIGMKEKEPEVIDRLLESGDRSLAPEAIEPKGLFLSDVIYEKKKNSN